MDKKNSFKRIRLKGSCHCGGVSFQAYSKYYFPYQQCYCSICRKTQGGGGCAINLSAEAHTLKIQGKKNIKIYRAKLKNPEDKRAHHSTGERHFCKLCSSGLWLYDPEWPDLIHPFASAIDTELPRPTERTHLMLEFKPSWVEVLKRPKDKKFQRYPKESIAQWHERMSKKS